MSELLDRWESRELTELQAYQILLNEEEEQRETAAAATEEDSGDRELTGDEILAVLDGNIPRKPKPWRKKSSSGSVTL